MSERNLAKNTIFYSAALAGQKVLSFFYFIILARSLGVAGQGRFTLALSFTSLFAIFLDLGLSQIMIRETARDPEHAQKYLSSIIAFKLAAAAFLYLIIIGATYALGYPELTRDLIYVSGLVMLVDSLTLSVYGVIRGRHNLLWESLGTLGNQAIVLAVGGALLWLGASPVLVMAVYLLASLANLIWASFNMGRLYGVRLGCSFDFSILKKLLLWSWPFALAGIFSRIFSASDVVILSKLSGEHAVGIYSAAFKVAFALQFAALAFSASLYPAFSSYYARQRDKLGQLFTKSIFWLMLLAGPLIFGVIAVADPVIPLVFGQEYRPSILPLQILMASLLFVFLSFPVGAILNACDRQGRHTFNLAVAAVVSVAMNFLLIPYFGPVGSAIANLISYIFLLGLGFMVVGKITEYDYKFLLLAAVKVFIACLALLLAVWLVKIYANVWLAIIVGAIAFFAAAYLLRLFSVRSVKEFIRSFKPAAAVTEEEK